MKKTNQTTQSGFALLLTLVVVSVVLAIGLSLLDITIKQLSLTSTARESELAFHAANTAMECSQYAKNQLLTPEPSIDIECAGITETVNRTTEDTDVYRYDVSFDWQNSLGQSLCSEVDMYMLDARGGDISYDLSATGLDDTKDCDEGNVCTVIFARGFNRPCGSLSSLQTVQRELTIDF